MAITGTIERDGTVTVTWNVQAERLAAPKGGHYLPCEVCGVVLEVTGTVVSVICPGCSDAPIRQYELDGREVEDVVEFMRQLDADGDRKAALGLKVGESMNLGGGAAPMFVLRRVS